jgi:hypothetical protein
MEEDFGSAPGIPINKFANNPVGINQFLKALTVDAAVQGSVYSKSLFGLIGY